MKPTFSWLFLALFMMGCAEDTRRPRDAAALADGSTDVGNDAGPDNSDEDMDGVLGLMDLCPATAPGDPIDANGCSTADADGDGVLNDRDECDDTPVGANVDTFGCPLENEGTLDATWLINGAMATSAACSAAGIVQVRLIIDRPGSNFLMRDFPCAEGSFDSREDMTAPRVPRNMTFMSYWQAIDSMGGVLAETAASTLILSNEVMHATLFTPDFLVD